MSDDVHERLDDKAEAQRFRDWARAEGHQICDRGRIPQAFVSQFQNAHAS
ncbi:Lsr2 family DNA-binding protein [Lentzea sp. E54]